jgi:hypothetical protein
LRAHHPRVQPQPTLDWSFHRQYELYRDRTRLTSRLAILTIVLSALLLFRVVEPLYGISVEVARKEAAIASLEGSRLESSVRDESLSGVAVVYAQVTSTLEEEPWNRIGSELFERVARLGRAYDRLLGATNDELRKEEESAPQVPVMVGSRLRSLEELALARPASFQWVEPPAPPLRPRPRPQSGNEELSPEQQAAVDEFDAARIRLDELGIDVGGGARESRTEGKTSPLPLAEALEVMGVDATDLAERSSFRERDEYLYRLLRERVAAEAEEAVGALVALGRNGIVVDDESSGLGVPLEELEAAVVEWSKAYAGNAEWRDELLSEPREARRLVESFEAVIATVGPAVLAEGASVRRDHEAAQAHSAELSEDLVAAVGMRDLLFERSERLLPVWVGEFTTPEQVLQGFPTLVCVLVLCVWISAWRAREHFLVFRRSINGPHEVARFNASSSVWTMAKRGPMGTFGTLLLYFGVLAAAYLGFERGTELMTEWAALGVGQPWAITTRISEAVPWFGRALFLACAGGVLLMVSFEDREPKNAPRPA